MKLLDLQQHFFNHNIVHAFRRVDLIHDVYKNKKNDRQVTIPNNKDEIKDELALFACKWLDIDHPVQLDELV
jgi:hypothetical protein